jgi:hypothetical protein
LPKRHIGDGQATKLAAGRKLTGTACIQYKDGHWTGWRTTTLKDQKTGKSKNCRRMSDILIDVRHTMHGADLNRGSDTESILRIIEYYRVPGFLAVV